MATILSFALFAVLIALTIWGALVVVAIAVCHFTGTAASVAWPWAQAGGGAMIFPGFWLGIYCGVPVGDGLLSSAIGESAAESGAMLGFATAMFCGVLLGAVAGAGLGVLRHLVRYAR
jgi:hypothetical protein